MWRLVLGLTLLSLRKQNHFEVSLSAFLHLEAKKFVTSLFDIETTRTHLRASL
jgi:hypothetical protein